MRFEIRGQVVHGDGYGKKIGFPTANLDRRHYVRLAVRPKLGVYAGRVTVGGRTYAAGIVVGPLDPKGLPKLEAHLLGFKGNLYGKKLLFDLVRYLRPFAPYSNERSLIRQIARDMVEVKKIIKP